jgi:OmpA-OmpF porin, OOP family
VCGEIFLSIFHKSLTICSLAVILMAAPASADGLYLGLAGGAGWTSDADIDGSGIDTSADFETGPVLGMSLGYGFGDDIRGEMELAGRWSDASSIGGTSASGDVTALSAMVNGFFDFQMDGALTPYIGAGVGGAQVTADDVSPVGSTSIDDKDAVLAYQAMLGVAYSLSDAMSLTADYRYFGTNDLGYTATDGTSVSHEYTNQSIMLGIRFDVGSSDDTMPDVDADMPDTTTTLMQDETLEPAPEAAPEPQETEQAATASDATQTAAAPAMPQFPRAYRILFDWNEDRLTNASFDVIRQAAENARSGGITRIEATGHTDTSGNIPFNMELSRRRAEAVLQALLNLGLTDEEIVIHWHGEAEPLIATGDGVRELQNRRVEIIFAGN